MSNVRCLPVWKKNASTAERFYELAEFAREHPDYFDKWVLVYAEDNDKRFKVRMMEGEKTRTSDALGVLTAGIQYLWEETKRGYP